MAAARRETENSVGGRSGRHTNDLADAYRRWGYLQADVDWLGRLAPYEHPDIADAAGRYSKEEIDKWRAVYAGTIGAEFAHIADRERCRWVADWLEGESGLPEREKIVELLARSELFERYLHTRYVGSKRYSIEGVAGLIPLLESVLDRFIDHGGELAMLAMSHRGRLNVMTNIAEVPPADMFAAMEDVDPRSVLGSGDVKYHLGATGMHTTPTGRKIKVHLSSNPSHLEAVDPVITGRVRAKQDRMGPDGPAKILCVTIHGDAAFAGQGVVAETLNLSGLHGYGVGGSIRIVANNLIGFTADFPRLHSSRYSSDVAKRLQAPILHVNAEDPEAIHRAGAFAADYRARFGDDVVIDLIGYRRYGHSEVEDPSVTQPLLYRKIEKRPMLWELYAERIGMSKQAAEGVRKKIWDELESQHAAGRSKLHRPVLHRLPPYWDRFRGGPYIRALEVETGVQHDELREIADRMASFPGGFNVHPKIRKLFEQRRRMAAGELPVDWGMAEALAMGSLLWEGIPVRIAGQDSRRGTFNQRHAAIIDTETGSDHYPLAHLRPGQGRFTALDSPLCETAALGFEYGYSREYPDALVCWEAQFGDFANVAQPIIDQFICAGEDKWRLLSGLVLLLPHGFEGQGPEHSSGRIERFLQLAGEDNIQVCQPATSGQYFHLLRRQALRVWRKPLVVFTPKSMLRSEAASSAIAEFTPGGSFKPVFPDPAATNAERLLLCTGKIAHELRAERERRGDGVTAILSLSQLYPFPKEELAAELARHPRARRVMWVQEEPANKGALQYIRPLLQRLLGERHLVTVKRSESASPATGSAKAHKLEQDALIRLAFS